MTAGEPSQVAAPDDPAGRARHDEIDLRIRRSRKPISPPFEFMTTVGALKPAASRRLRIEPIWRLTTGLR
jgi:hypothetical protein